MVFRWNAACAFIHKNKCQISKREKQTTTETKTSTKKTMTWAARAKQDELNWLLGLGLELWLLLEPLGVKIYYEEWYICEHYTYLGLSSAMVVAQLAERHQRSVVRIPTSAIKYFEFTSLSIAIRKDEKRKRSRNGPVFFLTWAPYGSAIKFGQGWRAQSCTKHKTSSARQLLLALMY